jgi:hypothetical protein
VDIPAGVRLPDEVIEALECLYPEQKSAQWLERYRLTCRRKRVTMVYLLLQEAGYASSR